MQNRRETWDIAIRKRDDLIRFAALPSDLIEKFKNTIVELAIAKGYFSIWTTVFHHDSDMIRRFIEAFPGTSRDCYETETYNPKSRHSLTRTP